ncbi:hypothetical protein ACFXK0_25210 [Nocardia sp. NPDC059177]|uniref:hypothetical protein n=1 Tax=Nocardia sp. NPDC059177 TaxID=3346759 RepID=UPI0036B04292
MTTSFRRFSRPTVLGGALTTALATAALLAPSVVAADRYVAAAGTDHLAGCSYQVTAVGVVGYSSGEAGARVTFYDNGQEFDSVTVPTIGTTTGSWRPATAGEHTLTVQVDNYGSPYWITPATVTVSENPGTGSAACGLPSFSG